MTAKPTKPAQPASKPIDATRLFRVLNPELFLPNNRYVMIFGITAFAAVTTYLAIEEFKVKPETRKPSAVEDGQPEPTYQEKMRQRLRDQQQSLNPCGDHAASSQPHTFAQYPFSALPPLVSHATGILETCQTIERRTFPKAEAMDLKQELAKPNAFLITCLDLSLMSAHTAMAAPAPLNTKQTSKTTVARSGRHAARSQPSSNSAAFTGNVHPQVRGYAAYVYSKRDGTIRIIKVAVVPTHRNKGIGTQLVQSILHQAIKAYPGATKAWLHVDPARPAAYHLYQKLGFQKISTIPGYYGHNRHADILERAFTP
ncbi:hypothetical protein H4R35_006430 [Dimargaris xerosporica]|nr:hypothetical protein H4R35_006430 [Dimargaris xerosporica]